MKRNPKKILLSLRCFLRHICVEVTKAFLARKKISVISIDDWAVSIKEPTSFYIWCYRYFYQHLPAGIKSHRCYFEQDGRGFGEKAFHTMWFLLFRHFKIRNFLEIGVYRGQVLSLAALMQRIDNIEGEVVGISPFSPAGDSASSYRSDIDYYDDTLANFRHFDLEKPRLIKAYSTDKNAIDVIQEKFWDCIYIDGSHEYETAKADWVNCSRNVKVGGIVVLDDSALETTYCPPVFASKGHPGPSNVASEIDKSCFREILRVGHNRVFQRMA